MVDKKDIPPLGFGEVVEDVEIKIIDPSELPFVFIHPGPPIRIYRVMKFSDTKDAGSMKIWEGG